MTLRKLSLIIVTFIVTVLCSTFVFAKDDNAIRDAGSAISNVTKDAGATMVNDVQKAGSGLENGIQNVGNSVKNGAATVRNTMENGIDKATDAVTNNDHNDSTYTATRTNAETGTFFGMGPVTWTWFALALAGIIIVALVWHYGTQNSRYNDND